MTLYKEEKKRIGSARWAIMTAILVFDILFYQTQMLEIQELKKQGKAFPPLSYIINIFGVVFFVCYLNQKLFYIKERGKSVYMIPKYEILPIRKRTWYFVKLRILAEQLFVLLAGSVAVYLFLSFANQLDKLDSYLLLKIRFLFRFAVVFTLLTVLIMDISQEYRLRRK